jgi:DNA-directed RNA polymerase subunit K/omega
MSDYEKNAANDADEESDDSSVASSMEDNDIEQAADTSADLFKGKKVVNTLSSSGQLKQKKAKGHNVKLKIVDDDDEEEEGEGDDDDESLKLEEEEEEEEEEDMDSSESNSSGTEEDDGEEEDDDDDDDEEGNKKKTTSKKKKTTTKKKSKKKKTASKKEKVAAMDSEDELDSYLNTHYNSTQQKKSAHKSTFVHDGDDEEDDDTNQGESFDGVEELDDDDDDDSEYSSDSSYENNEDYLQKLSSTYSAGIVETNHRELLQFSSEETMAMTKIVRDEQGTVCDPYHRTIPFLTKYEKARVLGERAKQINQGSAPFIDLKEHGMAHVFDGYLIACAELESKKIPFIVRRPIANGQFEFWKLEDLEIL